MTNAPITSPIPAGISIVKLISAIADKYTSYNPKADKIAALSTPGIIVEPATATPKQNRLYKSWIFQRWNHFFVD